MIGSNFTGHTAGCPKHCNTQLRAKPVCYAKHSAASYACCRIQAQQSFSTCSDSESTACTAYDRQHSHTGHKAGCLQHHNVQLRALPVCYAKHSAASYACCKHSGTAELQHMQCDIEITVCRAYDRQQFHRPHSRVSPALQYKAESNACLFCKALCCLFTLQQGFRHSRALAHAV